jgi:hypothetical protein
MRAQYCGQDLHRIAWIPILSPPDWCWGSTKWRGFRSGGNGNCVKPSSRSVIRSELHLSSSHYRILLLDLITLTFYLFIRCVPGSLFLAVLNSKKIFGIRCLYYTVILLWNMGARAFLLHGRVKQRGGSQEPAPAFYHFVQYRQWCVCVCVCQGPRRVDTMPCTKPRYMK